MLEVIDWHYPTSSVDASPQVPKLKTFIRILLRISDDNSRVNCSSVTGALVLESKDLEGTREPMGGVVEGLDVC